MNDNDGSFFYAGRNEGIFDPHVTIGIDNGDIFFACLQGKATSCLDIIIQHQPSIVLHITRVIYFTQDLDNTGMIWDMNTVSIR